MGFAAVVKMTTKPGHRDAAAQVLARYMDTIEGEEGTLAYILTADAGDDDVLWLYEEYADDPSLEAHLAAPPYAVMRDEVTEHMAAMPELIVVTPLRVKGRPLD